MNSKLVNGIIFVIGAGIGSAATWFAVKTTYEKKADAEIKEMKEYYENKYCPKKDTEDEESEEEDPEDPVEEKKVAVSHKREEKPSLNNYKVIINEEGYTPYSSSEKPAKEEPVPEEKFEKTEPDEWGPYVIRPEEFDEKEDYETVSLIYYAEDDRLTYSDGKLFEEDVEDLIGWENLNEIGKYEDDAVHVRNDEHKIDYEILRLHESWGVTMEDLR